MINILLDQPETAKFFVDSDEASDLEGYVTQILRVDPPVQGVYREAKANETIGSKPVNARDLIYLNVMEASRYVSFEASRCLDRISQPV